MSTQAPHLRAPASSSSFGSVPGVRSQASDGEASSRGSSVETYSATQSAFTDLSNFLIPNQLHKLYQTCRMMGALSPLHAAYIYLIPMFAMPSLYVYRKGSAPLPKKGQDDHLTTQDTGNGILAMSDDAETIQFAKEMSQSRLRYSLMEFIATRLLFSSAVAVIHRPYTRIMSCKKCNHAHALDPDNPDPDIKWSRNPSPSLFTLTCSSCGYTGVPNVSDEFVQGFKEVRLEVLDHTRIRSIRSGYGSGKILYYEIPREEIEELCDPARTPDDVWLNYPLDYLRAAFSLNASGPHDERWMRIRKENSFYAEDPSPIRSASGLPVPRIASSFSDTHSAKMMQKSNTQAASTQSSALTVIYPDVKQGANDLFSSVNVSRYMGQLHDMIDRHNKDPGYKAVMPIPVGSHMVGGEGKMLMMHQEIKASIEMASAALCMPFEFFFGGLSYSGSSVSVRQVETILQDHNTVGNELAQWFFDRILDFAGKDFAGFDAVAGPVSIGSDQTYTQALAGLAGAGQIGLHHVYRQIGTTQDMEHKQIMEDVKFRASMSKLEMEAQIETDRKNMITQARNQGAGLVHQTMATTDARAEALASVRENQALMEILKSDPQSASVILGQASMEMAGQPAPEPQTSFSTPESEETADGGEGDVLPQLVQLSAQIPPDQMPTFLNEVGAVYGPEILRQLQSAINSASAMYNAAEPEILPSQQPNMVM